MSDRLSCSDAVALIMTQNDDTNTTDYIRYSGVPIALLPAAGTAVDVFTHAQKGKPSLLPHATRSSPICHPSHPGLRPMSHAHRSQFSTARLNKPSRSKNVPLRPKCT